MFQELRGTNDFRDDTEKAIDLRSRHIGDFFADAAEEDKNTNAMSSREEELAYQVREYMKHATEQDDKIRYLLGLIQDVYKTDTIPSSEQDRYIDFYLSEMSDALDREFLRKDTQVNNIYSHILRLQDNLEENKDEIYKLSDILSNKDNATQSSNSAVSDAIAEEMNDLMAGHQVIGKKLQSQYDFMRGLEREIQQNRDQLQKASSHLNEMEGKYEPSSDLLEMMSKHLVQLSDQLQETSDKLERHLDQSKGVSAGPDELTPPAAVRDCSDLPDGSLSGVHLLTPRPGDSVLALCDLDAAGGGWTVIQRRADANPPEDFYRGWQDYKEGFGELGSEFWWGLENIWAVTSSKDRQYELRIDLEDFDGKRKHAIYQNFHISPESDGYRLSVSNYNGDAGDSLQKHSGQKFTTKDKDQDDYSGNCAKRHKGGWWYASCLPSSLNGIHFGQYRKLSTRGIIWQTFHGTQVAAINKVSMKIRPANHSNDATDSKKPWESEGHGNGHRKN